MSERGKSGIYAIVNRETGCRYVGQAVSIGDRWLTHRSALRRGVHHCRRLQASWNKRGEMAFEFVVLEYVAIDASQLAAREQHWFDELNPEYNSAPAAATCIGVKHPPRSDEFRQRQSEQRKGFKHSAETVEKLREIAARKRADGTMYRPTPEHREILRSTAKGLLHTPEAIEKRRKTMTGRKQSAEQIAKRVAKLIGHTTSEETRRRIGEANAVRLTGKKQSAETIEKRTAALRGRSRPDGVGYLGGKKRPPHVVEALAASNNARFAERRVRLIQAIHDNPGTTLGQLAEISGCDRETVAKYKQLLAAGEV